MRGIFLGGKRAFSLYDVEQFFRDAGAEKVSEKAVIDLEQELEAEVSSIIREAQLYANYAGRTRLIKPSDIRLVNGGGGAVTRLVMSAPARKIRKRIVLVPVNPAARRRKIVARPVLVASRTTSS